MGAVSMDRRLQRSQSFLSKWTSTRFNALGKQIETLRKERVALLNMRGNRDVSRELNQITSEINDLTNKEEIHRRHRSRVNWLAHGDRN